MRIEPVNFDIVESHASNSGVSKAVADETIGTTPVTLTVSDAR